MKSMKDKIPRKKKAKKTKQAKKHSKASRRAILEDSSDEDDFANKWEVAPVVNSEGTVPLEIFVSQNTCCTEPKGVKLSSMLKTNKTNNNRTYDNTISEKKEIEIPLDKEKIKSICNFELPFARFSLDILSAKIFLGFHLI